MPAADVTVTAEFERLYSINIPVFTGGRVPADMVPGDYQAKAEIILVSNELNTSNNSWTSLVSIIALI